MSILGHKIMNSVLAIKKTNTQQVNKLKPAFDELAHFLLSNNIKFDETSELLKSAFIDSARNMNNKKLNVSAISLKTGIDRRQIPKKSNKTAEEFNPRKKPDPIILILAELRRYAERNKTNCILKRAPGDSLYNICNKHKGRLTAPTLIKELIHMGCIEETSKNEVTIISTTIRTEQPDSRKFSYASNQIFKLVNTMRKNIQDPENSVLEWCVESTKINAKNKKLISQDVKTVRDYLRSHILNAVDEYESDVDDGTYEPFSLNFFVNSQ